MKEKGNPKVKEEILQRIKAKMLRSTDTSQGWVNSNRTGFFLKNEGQFHKQIDGSDEEE